MQIANERIYRSIFMQARGVRKKELVGHLRSRNVMRKSRHSTMRNRTRKRIVDAISISERPVEIEDRAVPGHWEGGLDRGFEQHLHRDAR